ncbi:MAG: ABC transporter substrate-binding protein [Thermomicrobiales bacterium]|nr:ABC transporter substrate-binding protein [Thermomicrobiales bacterium]
MSRRTVLSRGLQLGIATPLLTELWLASPASATTGADERPVALRPRALQDLDTGTFTIVRDGSTPDIDPHTAYDNLASAMFMGLYEMLVQYKGSATDEIAPVLAESWETSEDGLTVTFKIPEGVLFHDGSICDAQAVVDSFTRFLLLDQGPVMVLKRFMSTPEQLAVVDATTVSFTLDRPSPLFLPAMASEYGPFVINPRMVEENKTEEDPWAHEWFLFNASGTGPYTLVENSPSEQVVLQKFDDYHGGWDRPHFSTVVFRIVGEVATRRQLLENGNADAQTQFLTPDDVEAMRSNPDIVVETYPSTASYWVQMNTPRLRTPEARQGFSYAFPYDDVIDSAYRGLMKRSGPVPSTVIGYDPDVFLYQTDLDKAKELILSAGFNEGDSFDYMFQGGDAVERVIAQLFQANVQAMGFNLELIEVDRSALLDAVHGDSPAEERPMFFGGWSWWPDYNDPWNQLDPNFSPKEKGATANGGWWTNERFSELMSLSQNFQTEEELNEWMKEIQNILTELDPPAIFLGEALYYTVLRSDIKGFVPNPIYLGTFNLSAMYRETSA